ncbi:MAG: hypothetical protein ACI9R3_004648 [Verrucomicrobiales bacterium]
MEISAHVFRHTMLRKAAEKHGVQYAMPLTATSGATKAELIKSGEISYRDASGTRWFHLSSTPADDINARLATLCPLYEQLCKHNQLLRLGQTLEIAIFKAH